MASLNEVPTTDPTNSEPSLESGPVSGKQPAETPSGLLNYAQRYLEAAVHIPDERRLFQPRCLLYGLAAELALKAFLSARGGKYPRSQAGHDLVRLLTDAEKIGLRATDHERTDVIRNLNTVYYESTAGWRYPSRYPPPATQVYLTPTREWMEAAITSFLTQARAAISGK